MAYLKGGTIIDGNVYIEGGLRVKQIVGEDGSSLPSLWSDSSSYPNRLIKFMNIDGKMHYTKLAEESSDEIAYERVRVAANQFFLSLGLDDSGLDRLDALEINKLQDSSSNPYFKLNVKATPNNISVSEESLIGLIKSDSGDIIIGGINYREASEGEIPDIFYYG